MKFLIVAAAAAALGSAGAAHAQYPGQYGYNQYGSYNGGNDWQYGRSRYSLFERDYRHTIEGIRHGLRDGSFSRRQADRFYRELESIRYEAIRLNRYGNYQPRYIQARMERLHQWMHVKHDRNHERYDGYGYGAYQPAYNYRGGHRHDDDHDDN